MRNAHLKKRQSRDGNAKHWTWCVRYPLVAGGWASKAIGFNVPLGDDWCPNASLTRLTRGEAEGKLKEYAGVKPTPVRPDDKARMSWGAFSDQYIESRREILRYSTLVGYADDLIFFHKVCAPATPAHVTPDMASEFVQAQLKAGYSRKTVNKRVGTLRAAWRLSFKGIENPFAVHSNLKAPKLKWHVYVNEEVESVRGVVHNEALSRIILTAYLTALRKGELCNLVWSDLDLDENRVHVEPKVDTAETWQWDIKDTDRRVVPMPVLVKRALLSLRGVPGASPTYVFLSKERQQRILARRDRGEKRPNEYPICSITRNWNSACRRAGVTKCRFHSLRGSCITNWLRAGVRPHVVREWAGHSDIATTMGYVQALEKDMVQAMPALDLATAGMSA